MDTLEQRVARLERSGRRWRLGCLALAGLILSGATTQPAGQPDARFGHLTVNALTIRSGSGGAFVSATCDSDQASITLASPGSQTLIQLVAQKGSANALISRRTDKGMSSATVITDDQSALIDLHGVDGKDKEIEPE